MIKVIFFVSAPFCERDYQRYGMDIFFKSGLDIYVWDFTYALYPHLKGVLVPPDPIQWERHIIFDSTQEVIAALKLCSEKTIIFCAGVGPNRDTLGIYRAIVKKKIPYILTPPTSCLPKLEPIIPLMQRFNPKRLVKSILKWFPPEFFGISAATFIIAEGLKSNSVRLGVTAKTKLMRTHALDYDIYLQLGDQETCNSNTVVFLDQNLPYHSDSLFSGESAVVAPQVYYAELGRFFDFLEKKHKLKVVIAAHPRSKYDQSGGGLFGERSIIKGKTAELVKGSSLVITHWSTSISFAVLYKKQIVFLTTNEINNNKEYKYIQHIKDFSHLLGANIINISEDINDELSIKQEISDSLYKKYLNNYIKVDGSDKLPQWQIVCNTIKQYFQGKGYQ